MAEIKQILRKVVKSNDMNRGNMKIINRYPKGIETKKQIIEETKRHFYEKGFSKATISEICDSIDVKVGTFTYYYKQKLDILEDIYGDLSETCLDFVKKNEDKELSTFETIVRASFIYYHAIFRDEKTVNFHLEVLKKTPVSVYSNNVVNYLYPLFNEEIKLGLSNEEIEYIAAADKGVRRELTMHLIKSHGNRISVEAILDFCERIISFMSRLLTIDESYYQKTILESRKFIEKFDYSTIRLLT